MTISFEILANFAGEIHRWTILKNTISLTIFWTRIRVKFLFFHDFWYFCYFPWLSMTTNFSMTFSDFPWLWEPCQSIVKSTTMLSSTSYIYSTKNFKYLFFFSDLEFQKFKPGQKPYHRQICIMIYSFLIDLKFCK